MIRAILGLSLLAVVAAIAVWLAENPGNVSVNWQGWRIESSAAAALIVILLFASFIAVIYRFWLWLRKGPQRMGKTREEDRRRQGYRALSRGMVAVAAGDLEESHKLARRAEALLEDPPLTLLLSAQSAQLNGDDTAAERYFEAMLGNNELEFLGLRGLLSSAMRKGESRRALEYAQRAYKIRPSTNWIQDTLLELQVENSEWKKAELLLKEIKRRGEAFESTTNRRRAILFIEQAKTSESSGKLSEAVRFSIRANSVYPEFVPAATIAARILGRAGKIRRAVKIIEKTWRVNPHPDLVRSIVMLFPEENPNDRRERFQRLDALKPGHAEGLVALIRAALDVRDLQTARKHLELLSLSNKEARVCSLWAELEDAQHGPGLAAREWLLKAASAPPDPSWNCKDCGRVCLEWSSVCPHCESFDTLDWGQGIPSESLSILQVRGDFVYGKNEGTKSNLDPEPPQDQKNDQLLEPPMPDVPATKDSSLGSA